MNNLKKGKERGRKPTEEFCKGKNMDVDVANKSHD